MNSLIYIPIALLVVAIISCVYITIRLLHEELAANRAERGELLQRIQAPQAAIAEHAYNAVKDEANQVLDDEQRLDQEWEQSEDSLVPFDEDLQFDFID